MGGVASDSPPRPDPAPSSNPQPKPPLAMSTEPDPILEIKDLIITRSRVGILNGVTWRVGRGEHWVMLGANGSGKTSLLSALTGYLMPTSGSIDLMGQRYGRADWRRLRQHIGLVSSSIRQMMADTEPALETVVSGKYAEIDLWRTIPPADRRKAMQILRQTGCLALAGRPWAFLSQGERQRVLIGRALMADPALLILDEPCAGLDPVAREYFLEWMNRLGAEPDAPTMVLVTHHVEEITPAFTHALLLKDGANVVSGPVSKALTSATLSETFKTPVRLRKRQGRYALQVDPTA